jgi:hypothetical protein
MSVAVVGVMSVMVVGAFVAVIFGRWDLDHDGSQSALLA